jgi:hypothetical protein
MCSEVTMNRAWYSIIMPKLKEGRPLVRISPPIGSPDGKTTLVGNGRTREVIGHTTAKPVSGET